MITIRRFDLSTRAGINTYVQTRLYENGASLEPVPPDKERADVIISVDAALTREELEFLIASAVHDLLAGSARYGGEVYDPVVIAREALLEHPERSWAPYTYDHLAETQKARR